MQAEVTIWPLRDEYSIHNENYAVRIKGDQIYEPCGCSETCAHEGYTRSVGGTFEDTFDKIADARHWAIDILVAYFDWSTGTAAIELSKAIDTMIEAMEYQRDHGQRAEGPGMHRDPEFPSEQKFIDTYTQIRDQFLQNFDENIPPPGPPRPESGLEVSTTCERERW